MNRFHYPVLLTPAEEGGSVVTCRDFPQLITQSDTEQDALKQAGISKQQLARRLGIDEKEVRRLLDPHYGSKLPRIAQAISALGQRLVIGLEPA